MFYRLLATTAFIITILNSVQSQTGDPGLVNQMYSAKAGPFGAWISYERPLASSITLNAEIGLHAGYGGFTMDGNFRNYLVLTPGLRLEPRFYYNIGRRTSSGKDVRDNAGNYFSLSTTWLPDLFTISNRENVSVKGGVAIVPKWGLRRNLGDRFFFEFAIGAGAFLNKHDTRFILDTDIKVGLRF